MKTTSTTIGVCTALLLGATGARAAEAEVVAPMPTPAPTPAAAVGPAATASPDATPAPKAAEASAPAAPAAPAAEDPDATIRATVHNGTFVVRDRNDFFRLQVQGRMHVDSWNWFGPGVQGTSLKPTMFLRRVRTELTGELWNGKVQWALHGEWGMGTPSTDNAKGTNQAAPGRYAAAEGASVKATPADAWINWRADPLFNIQFGQFDAPFTMENRTSDKSMPFIERSIVARAVGVPTNKEIGVMFWGQTADKRFYYSAGVFNGDGQSRPNVDARYDGLGRAYVRPLATGKGALKDLQIGASFRYGVRDDHDATAKPFSVTYDYAALSTQGNYAFWSPSYTSSKGATHVVPNGTQLGVGGELRIPWSEYFDFRGELVYVHNQTREAVEGYQASSAERYGTMSGYAYYAQVGFWPFGHRDIQGMPGDEFPTRVDLKSPQKAPVSALELLIKWEQLSLKYASADRGGTADANAIDGKIRVNALSLGANFWATRHLRLSANWVVDMFPDSAPTKPYDASVTAQSSDQRAVAPGQSIAKGIDDSAHDHAHVVHEVMFRAAIAF